MALNSKRMQIFFNEFLITNTNFLNKFTSECENRFFEFERKLNRIESNLTIIEAKLESVKIPKDQESNSNPEVKPSSSTTQKEDDKTQITLDQEPKVIESTTQEAQQETHQIQPEQPAEASSNLIKISESYHYKKFFKMVKFGVPAHAVKLKMTSEGLDGEKLENPDLLIEKCPEDDEVEEE